MRYFQHYIAHVNHRSFDSYVLKKIVAKNEIANLIATNFLYHNS